MQENKTMTDYKRSLCDRILDTTLRTIVERGVKGTKMDDVAASLGISKRTLYELYSTKETVLYEALHRFHKQKAMAINDFASDPQHDVVDIIIHIYRTEIKRSINLKPGFYDEMAKFPRIEAYLCEYKRQNGELFLRFLQRGVDEGYFLPDVDYPLICRFLEAQGNYLREQRLDENYTFGHLFYNTMLVTLRGCCTKKGINKLDAFFR